MNEEKDGELRQKELWKMMRPVNGVTTSFSKSKNINEIQEELLLQRKFSDCITPHVGRKSSCAKKLFSDDMEDEDKENVNPNLAQAMSQLTPDSNSNSNSNSKKLSSFCHFFDKPVEEIDISRSKWTNVSMHSYSPSKLPSWHFGAPKLSEIQSALTVVEQSDRMMIEDDDDPVDFAIQSVKDLETLALTRERKRDFYSQEGEGSFLFGEEFAPDVIYHGLTRQDQSIRLLETVPTTIARANMISPKTMSELLGVSNKKQYLVIDCRFDYEYEGGHITGALNINDRDLLYRLLFTYGEYLLYDNYLCALKNDFKAIQDNLFQFKCVGPKNSVPPIIIFHCEFSQYRGPTIYSALRTYDREINLNHYPKLYYPEIYVLEGGYKGFHSFYPELCTPHGYVKMEDEQFTEKMEWSMAKYKRDWDRKKMKTFSLPALNKSRTVNLSPFNEGK